MSLDAKNRISSPVDDSCYVAAVKFFSMSRILSSNNYSTFAIAVRLTVTMKRVKYTGYIRIINYETFI